MAEVTNDLKGFQESLIYIKYKDESPYMVTSLADDEIDEDIQYIATYQLVKLEKVKKKVKLKRKIIHGNPTYGIKEFLQDWLDNYRSVSYNK